MIAMVKSAYFVVALKNPFTMPANSNVAVTFECYFYNCFDSPCAIEPGIGIELGIIGDNINAYGFSGIDTIADAENVISYPVIGSLNPITINNESIKINQVLAKAGTPDSSTMTPSLGVAFNISQEEYNKHHSVRITLPDYDNSATKMPKVIYLPNDGYDAAVGSLGNYSQYWLSTTHYYDYFNYANNLLQDCLIELSESGELNTGFVVTGAASFTDTESGKESYGFSSVDDVVGACIPYLSGPNNTGDMISDSAYATYDSVNQGIEKFYISTRDGVKSVFVRTNKMFLSDMVLVSEHASRQGGTSLSGTNPEAQINMTYNLDTNLYEHNTDADNQDMVDVFYDNVIGSSSDLFIVLVQPHDQDACSSILRLVIK